jgi:hypothetical protein
MTETVIRRRIEVLADEPLIPAIVKLAADAGIAHYTLLPTLGGVGHGGRWRDDQLSGATSKVMLLAVAGAQTADRFTDLLEPLLEPRGLILLISSVNVVRGARFE